MGQKSIKFFKEVKIFVLKPPNRSQSKKTVKKIGNKLDLGIEGNRGLKNVCKNRVHRDLRKDCGNHDHRCLKQGTSFAASKRVARTMILTASKP